MRAMGCASLLRPVVPADFEQFVESFPVTNMVGHEQDQFAIEIGALPGAQARMQCYEPGKEIIGVFDPWLCMQFIVHAASLGSLRGAAYRIPHSL